MAFTLSERRSHRSWARLGAVVAVLVGVAVAASGPTARAEDPTSDVDTELLSELVDADADDPTTVGVSGQAAVDVLEAADATEMVAVGASMAVEELVEDLVTDETLFVTGEGLLGYEDVLWPSDRLVGSTDSSAAAALPLGTDVAALQSLPTARRTIFLDFDGHTTSGDPAWNTPGRPKIESAAFTGSQGQIHQIWREVSEDFVPFAVNVTTKDPGVDALRKSSPSDTDYGQRVVISPTNWTGDTNTLGIALIGSFDQPADRSAFVFPGTLSPSNIAAAISHETGHTLGLHHDGVGSSAYYHGHNQWAPLMGNPIGKAVTQWSKGEYSGASNQEDDVAILAGQVGLRANEVGAVLTVGSAVSGVIRAVGDTDTFSLPVTSSSGALQVTVTPAKCGSNLFPIVSVRNASGAIVATGQPAGPAWTSLTVPLTSLAPGTHRIEIAGTGWGLNPSTGFSSYGSMGQYLLHVDAVGPFPFDRPAHAYATATRLSMQSVC